MSQAKIICCIPSCNREQSARSFCKNHYKMAQRRGILEFFPKTKRRNLCLHDGCTDFVKSNGLCSLHLDRKKAGLDLDMPKRHKSKDGICEIEGCSNKHVAKGLCSMHRHRIIRNQNLLGPNRKKSDFFSYEDIKWSENAGGYLCGVFKKKVVLQHRVFWELHHGRKLEPFENIHHKNGIRTDNRIENLELWTKPQPCGQRPEDLVAWVLEHYREEVLRQIDTRIEQSL